jgi:hypothetical protein
MSDQDIKNYFGAVVIYKWDGSMDELQQHMFAVGNSYNVLMTGGIVYFGPTYEVTDPRASVWFDNTGGTA